MIDKLTATPTPNFRKVMRDADGGVVQQRFHISRNTGSTRETSFYVWLDLDHKMFSTVEAPDEIKRRQDVEEAFAKKNLTITRT